eukprot:Gb_28578 [translate_table: standard]
MLEQLLIFTRGGLVLWTWRELGNALKGSPIDALIRSCLLEERSGDASYQYIAAGAAYKLKWIFHNELGLVFVAVYQRILHLLYVDELLAIVKHEFTKIYDPRRTVYTDFDDTFRQLLKEVEARSEDMKKMKQQTKVVEFLKNKKAQIQKTGLQKNRGKPSGQSEAKVDAIDEDAHDRGTKLALVSKGEANSPINGVKNANGKVGRQTFHDNSSDEDGDVEKHTEAAFDVNKLHNLRPRTGKKVGPVPKPLNEDQGKRKPKKNRVWDDAPHHSKLDFTDPIDDRAEEKGAVLSDQGKSMMDTDEYISTESEIEEEEVEESTFSKKKGWFSSIFQR